MATTRRPSLVYRSGWLYDLLMLGLYGRHFFARDRCVADLIPAGVSVLDVCCGPASLYRRYLRAKGIGYFGLDLNSHFIARLRRLGAEGRVWDVSGDAALPAADYVVMQASLYHFLPDPGPVVDRMLRAARRQVIIAEPVRNLATSGTPWLARVARRQTDPGASAAAVGPQYRFNVRTLEDFFSRYRRRIQRTFPIPGGRERVIVLNADGEEPVDASHGG